MFFKGKGSLFIIGEQCIKDLTFVRVVFISLSMTFLPNPLLAQVYVQLGKLY